MEIIPTEKFNSFVFLCGKKFKIQSHTKVLSKGHKVLI
jgi:hypothetical protein